MTSPWVIERFKKSHDRSQFDCGIDPPNAWLRKQVSQYERHNLARTYVAIQPGEAKVLGYYSLSHHRVVYEALPREQAAGPTHWEIPVVLISRLAVDRAVQGRHLGEQLLLDALRRVQHISKPLGIRAVVAAATNVAARYFYRQYGFQPLTDAPHHYILPLQVIHKLKLPRR